jgi:uncharacterized protein (DUF58 family)
MKLNEIPSFGNLELLARHLVDGFITGMHRSPYHGFSVEFAEHRIFNPGESTRYIDWKVYGRTDRLYTKIFEEETNLRCYLLLDTSASMYYPKPGNDKIKFSAVAAAAIVNLMQRQRDAFSLIRFSEGITSFSPVKTTVGHKIQLYQELTKSIEDEAPEKGTNLPAVLHEIASRIHRRAMVVLFSDMFDHHPSEDLFSALQHLKHNKHEVIIFHVTDMKTERYFEFDNVPYEFIDAETGAKLKLHPKEMQEAYREKMEKTYAAISEQCRRYGMAFEPVDTADDIEKVMLRFLVKRKKMG